MAKGFDEKCGDLARYFVEGHAINTPENVDDLASDIQHAVELWFNFMESLAAAATETPYREPPEPLVEDDYDDETRDGKADDWEARQERET